MSYSPLPGEQGRDDSPVFGQRPAANDSPLPGDDYHGGGGYPESDDDDIIPQRQSPELPPTISDGDMYVFVFSSIIIFLAFLRNLLTHAHVFFVSLDYVITLLPNSNPSSMF